MQRTPARTALLARVAAEIRRLPTVHVLRVGVDGVDGAGKTVFADELAETLTGLGGAVIRASVDGFHHPRSIRYRRGRGSPEGFFRDSYDYSLLREVLLDPLGPGGSGRFRRAVHDIGAELPVEMPEEQAEPCAMLVFDGIFLHRPELRDCWDYSVFLRVPFKVSIPRGAQRGTGSPDTAAPSNRRYVEGQRIYLRECDPMAHASVVIDNTDLDAPFVVAR